MPLDSASLRAQPFGSPSLVALSWLAGVLQHPQLGFPVQFLVCGTFALEMRSPMDQTLESWK